MVPRSRPKHSEDAGNGIPIHRERTAPADIKKTRKQKYHFEILVVQQFAGGAAWVVCPHACAGRRTGIGKGGWTVVKGVIVWLFAGIISLNREALAGCTNWRT